jgi:hypothetical protein
VAFKKQAARAPVPATPEALYRVLSHGPAAPRELWSWQADVLRAYDGLKGKSGQFSADVAIELPTGAGKTLVGCLIAEWRRRKYEEAVAYVAPTRQLAQQATAKGRLYGIPVVDLTGSHKRWDPASVKEVAGGEWRSADSGMRASFVAWLMSTTRVRPRLAAGSAGGRLQRAGGARCCLD